MQYAIGSRQKAVFKPQMTNDLLTNDDKRKTKNGRRQTEEENTMQSSVLSRQYAIGSKQTINDNQ
ncbi:MAG: hypothetical protein B6D44_02055 [Ignavibacteriales bacterium UTCHB2]|nr:MAG: hypothetical protein B6D44_02055 [Ignavibacteriales bacterium UTCHB2]